GRQRSVGGGARAVVAPVARPVKRGVTAEGRFDAGVVGAGQAGPSLAGRLTGAGMTVALVERHLFGGTCVNTGCMPTKALVASAYAAHMARRARDFGVLIDALVRVDMHAVQARAPQGTLDARANLEKWMTGMRVLRVVRGHARFESPATRRVGDALLAAPRIFLNVGGRATVPPDMPGIGTVEILTNTDIVALDTVPDHLVVVGGSYI